MLIGSTVSRIGNVLLFFSDFCFVFFTDQLIDTDLNSLKELFGRVFHMFSFVHLQPQITFRFNRCGFTLNRDEYFRNFLSLFPGSSREKFCIGSRFEETKTVDPGSMRNYLQDFLTQNPRLFPDDPNILRNEEYFRFMVLISLLRFSRVKRIRVEEDTMKNRGKGRMDVMYEDVDRNVYFLELKFLAFRDLDFGDNVVNKVR